VWRIGTPLVALLSGALFVASAQSSGGTDLRPGRYDDLASLVDAEAERYDRLADQVIALNEEVAELGSQVEDDAVQRMQAEVDRLRDPAGLVKVAGPGLRITLSDSPDEVIDAATGDKNLLVVHQQDIQAVVNALWKGGAEAVTIQGQRVISTTGIKCEGNSVTLQGVPYPQPYVISGIGDQKALLAALEMDATLEGYRADAADPEIGIGWDLSTQSVLTAPAYDGLLDLSYATVDR
jgi:uncharacterized protein YlxW (UPF0749 family)